MLEDLFQFDEPAFNTGIDIAGLCFHHTTAPVDFFIPSHLELADPITDKDNIIQMGPHLIQVNLGKARGAKYPPGLFRFEHQEGVAVTVMKLRPFPAHYVKLRTGRRSGMAQFLQFLEPITVKVYRPGIGDGFPHLPEPLLHQVGRAHDKHPVAWFAQQVRYGNSAQGLTNPHLAHQDQAPAFPDIKPLRKRKDCVFLRRKGFSLELPQP